MGRKRKQHTHKTYFFPPSQEDKYAGSYGWKQIGGTDDFRNFSRENVEKNGASIKTPRRVDPEILRDESFFISSGWRQKDFLFFPPTSSVPRALSYFACMYTVCITEISFSIFLHLDGGNFLFSFFSLFFEAHKVSYENGKRVVAPWPAET